MSSVILLKFIRLTSQWDRVPDETGCYTTDIKLVDKEAKAQQQSNRRNAAALPEFGLLPKRLVETVVRDRSGEMLTPDAKQGRWKSVLGKLGAYTLIK